MISACGENSNKTNTNLSTKKDGKIMPGLSHGFEQSPINISSKNDVNGKHKIELHFNDEINEIENLGHTVQLDFKPGSSLIEDDTLFNFKQCHFHTPSEHLIDSQSFALEMHIVNIMPNADTTAIPQYLVFGILFKEGKENKFLNDFLDLIPKEEHEIAALKNNPVKLSDLFGQIPKSLDMNFYSYRGSLTTPPYTESVRWFISKHIFEASAAQIETLKKIEGNNARHVQALYGRVVESD
jgi:carbonic anhydrase